MTDGRTTTWRRKALTTATYLILFSLGIGVANSGSTAGLVVGLGLLVAAALVMVLGWPGPAGPTNEDTDDSPPTS